MPGLTGALNERLRSLIQAFELDPVKDLAGAPIPNGLATHEQKPPPRPILLKHHPNRSSRMPDTKLELLQLLMRQGLRKEAAFKEAGFFDSLRAAGKFIDDRSLRAVVGAQVGGGHMARRAEEVARGKISKTLPQVLGETQAKRVSDFYGPRGNTRLFDPDITGVQSALLRDAQTGTGIGQMAGTVAMGGLGGVIRAGQRRKAFILARELDKKRMLGLIDQHTGAGSKFYQRQSSPSQAVNKADKMRDAVHGIATRKAEHLLG